MELLDCLVIGGGPAGLTAGIYLARFMRKITIVDAGGGRTSTHEHNDNYFGFPKGIKASTLTKRGIEQAKSFGVEIKKDKIVDIVKKDDIFNIAGLQEEYFAKSIIFATGVTDFYPQFDKFQDYVGRSMFWCITCDGYKTIGKRVVIVGNSDESVTTCLQFLCYTKKLIFVTNEDKADTAIRKKAKNKLKKYNIPLYESKITNVLGKKGIMSEVELEDGTKIKADMIFNENPARPNSELAELLNVRLNEFGYIESDENQRTNIPFVYAAGDVTRAFAHQIITAAHEGSMAAQSCNYDLYNPDQRD